MSIQVELLTPLSSAPKLRITWPGREPMDLSVDEASELLGWLETGVRAGIDAEGDYREKQNKMRVMQR